jgi:hypothetical protein
MPLTFDTLSSIYGPSNSPTSTGSNIGDSGSKTIAGALIGPPQTGQDASAGQMTIIPGLEGTIFSKPVTHWFVLAAAAVGVYYLAHKYIKGAEGELSTPRVGLASFWSIGVQALLFIVLVKAVFTKYRVPGLTELVASA